MKYLVITLTAIALISIGLYFGLTYYKSTPKVSTPVNTGGDITQTPSKSSETNLNDDLTTLDRDLTESDSLDASFEAELKKL